MTQLIMTLLVISVALSVLAWRFDLVMRAAEKHPGKMALVLVAVILFSESIVDVLCNCSGVL